MKISGGGECRHGLNRPVIGGKNNVLHLHARGGGGAVRRNVVHDDAPGLRQSQAVRQSRRDLLRTGADLDVVHVSILAQAAIDKIDHARRDGKAQSFASAALTQDESVDADHMAVHVHQRTAAVARIDRRVGLNIVQRFCGIGLPRHCADHAHRDRILQSLGTADRQYHLSHTNVLRLLQRQRGQIGLFNLEQRQIALFVDPDSTLASNSWRLPAGMLVGEPVDDIGNATRIRCARSTT